MKTTVAVIAFAALVTAGSIEAVPKTCVMYYPKVCEPIVRGKEVKFTCPVEKRKFVTKFGLMDFFRSPYMPETMKFIPHDLDHFIWECPE